jgi:hypothetical protein
MAEPVNDDAAELEALNRRVEATTHLALIVGILGSLALVLAIVTVFGFHRALYRQHLRHPVLDALRELRQRRAEEHA